MAELFIGIFAWLAATGMGMRLLRLMGTPPATPSSAGPRLSASEKWVYGSVLGLGVLAYLVFVFGSLGFLSRPFWVIFLGGLFAIGAPELGRAWNETVAVRETYSGFLRLAMGLTGIAMLAALCGALAPAIGQDELCYHLSQPANYIREGRVYAVPYSTNSLWPYLMEMLFTLGLVLRNESVAKFFHWAMTITAGGAVYCWVRRLDGGREEARWSMLVYLASPAVFIQASFAYVDSALAAYTLLGVLALVVALRENSIQWTVLAGIFAGFAASTKLLGLFAGALGVAALLSAFRAGGGKKALSIGAVYVLTAAIFGGAWYVRAWVLRGNPVFPFYPEWFGAGWHDSTYVDAHGRPGILGFLTFPWDLTMRPVWFGGEAPGPLFLMFVPAAFLWGAPLRARMAAMFGLLYATLWFKIDPNARFFFPALAFFAVPAGFAISAMTARRDVLSWACRLMACAILASSAALGIYHFHDEAEVLIRQDRNSYLRRNERSFGAAEAINAAIGSGARILSVGEARGFSFNLKHPFVLEGDFENMTRYSKQVTDADAVVKFWHDKGFTHLLSSDLNTVETDPLRASSILENETLRKKFFEETLVVRSGGVRYVLYKIL